MTRSHPDLRPYSQYPPEYAAMLVQASQWHEGQPTITLGPFTFREVHAARRDLYRYRAKLEHAVLADHEDQHARWLLSVFNGIQLRIEPLAGDAKGRTHCLSVHPNPLVAALRQLPIPVQVKDQDGNTTGSQDETRTESLRQVDTSRGSSNPPREENKVNPQDSRRAQSFDWSSTLPLAQVDHNISEGEAQSWAREASDPRHGREPSIDDIASWRCPCGSLNSQHHTTCLACLQPKEPTP